jgi:dolichol-phosphate mannosyltransferase
LIVKLSLVIPVYKSANTLAELHRRIGRVVKQQNWDCEVIYVNDASPDNSLEVLQSLPPEPAHRTICLKTNLGQSSALLCGMFFAQGDFIGTLDADLQDDPEHLPRLLLAFRKNTEVVFAGRAGNYESKGKLLTSAVFKTWVHLVSGRTVPNNAGLFLVISRDAAQKIIPFLPNDPYLIGLVAKLRLCCQTVTVNREANHLGQSSYTFRKRLAVARQFFRTLSAEPPPSPYALSVWIDNHVQRSSN